MKLNIKETVSFLRGLLWASCIIVGTLMLFRLLFVFLYVPGNILTAQSSDLFKVLYNALRFDFQIAAYAALLPSVIMLSCCLFLHPSIKNGVGISAHGITP